MLQYDQVKNWCFDDVVQSYSERDTILYALGLGFGADPLDPDDLAFVYEPGLVCVPTQAAVLGSPGFFWRTPVLGADWVRIVHGEQDIEWLSQLPPSGTVVGRTRVVGLTDKGEAKGALAQVLRELFDQRDGRLLARVRQVVFLRGDGGYSSGGGASDPAPPPLPPMPPAHALPDHTVAVVTLPQAALIYRLSGDMNPLHADPAVAKRAGFARPILHGLCTYGLTVRALLPRYLENNPARLRRLACRFTAPVFPGEAVRFEVWRKDDFSLSFRARVEARDATVLDQGHVEIARP